MTITKEEQDTKGRFVAVEDGEELGEMTYSVANEGKLLIVDHTSVNEGHEGKGVGKKLFNHLVDTVRTEGRKVMPLCPFAKAMLEKNKDKWDVLSHGSL